jgi:hypothetical protein
MGTIATITASTFPKQSDLRGKRVKAIFHYETTRQVEGVLLRDDVEEPFRTVIHLDDGRVVLGCECQYQPML